MIGKGDSGTGRLPAKPDKAEKQHLDELLDEALDESFPASDPPAMTEPAGSIATDRSKIKR